MTKFDEKKLIRNACSGDVAAFEALIARYQPVAFRFACHVTGGDEMMASDILQNSLLKAFLAIKKFNGRSAFCTWLWRIIRNDFLDQIKKYKKEMGNICYDEQCHPCGETPEGSLYKRELSLMILTLLTKLSKKQEDAITLVELQGLSYKEAATTLKITESALKVNLHRGKDKLKKLLKKYPHIQEQFERCHG